MLLMLEHLYYENKSKCFITIRRTKMVEESKKNKSKYVIDKVTRAIFLICALIAVISLVLIIGFVFYKG